MIFLHIVPNPSTTLFHQRTLQQGAFFSAHTENIHKSEFHKKNLVEQVLRVKMTGNGMNENPDN